MRAASPWPWIGALLLLASAAAAWPLIAGFFASGDCVSSGGSYDYLSRRCDFANNHPFVPVYRMALFWLAAPAGLSGLWFLGRKPAGHGA